MQPHDLPPCFPRANWDVALLPSLAEANWDVACRTYGSSHSTLIGLLVQWWVGLDPSHYVLDGAPSCEGRKGGGYGDALLCDGEGPAGTIEVQGVYKDHLLKKLKSIEGYFKSPRHELDPIGFGILLAYQLLPRGSRANRAFLRTDEPPLMDAATSLSERHGKKSLIVLATDKELDKDFGNRAVRKLAGYYSGTLRKVTGVHFKGGKEIGRRQLFPGVGD
jgi:hypothetical protein